LEYFWTTFVNLVDGAKIVTILILFLVDFILGVVVALKNGTFQLDKIANFLNTSVLYFLGGYLLLGVAAAVEPAINEAWVTAAFALLDATMVGFIIAKLKALGVPIPDQIGPLKIPPPKS
jgi:poly-beta-hydroxyalkanoate depolymerase